MGLMIGVGMGEKWKCVRAYGIMTAWDFKGKLHDWETMELIGITISFQHCVDLGIR